MLLDRAACLWTQNCLEKAEWQLTKHEHFLDSRTNSLALQIELLGRFWLKADHVDAHAFLSHGTLPFDGVANKMTKYRGTDFGKDRELSVFNIGVAGKHNHLH